jgi:hypothetical protein
MEEFGPSALLRFGAVLRNRFGHALRLALLAACPLSFAGGTGATDAATRLQARSTSTTVAAPTAMPEVNVAERQFPASAIAKLNFVPGQHALIPADAGRLATGPGSQGTFTTAQSDSNTNKVGASYYIDATRGSDGDPGTFEKPWRTLARLATVRLAPGQGIYLRCGGTWRESLLLGPKQLIDGAIIAGYGSECGDRKATISGADEYTGGWERSGKLWSRGLPSGTPKITQLFVERQALHTARWPNDEVGPGRMALVRAGPSSKIAAALNPGDTASMAEKDLVGATVHVRTQPWFMETRRVTGLSNDRLEFDRSTDWTVDAGEGFVLQDKLWMLDAPGEFFHDTSAQRLYLIAPEDGVPADLNAAHVEGSVRDIALALTQRSNLVVRDLALIAAREDGLRITDAPQVRIERVEARGNMSAGVRIWQWEKIPDTVPGPIVIDSLVAGNGQYGIDAQHTERAQIRSNRVLSTGTAGHHLAGVFASIAAGPGAATEQNLVDGSGYIGIRFSSLAGSSISRNSVSGYCRRLSDCGGIYTWTGRDLAAARQFATVEGNRITAASAQLEGTTSDGRDVVVGVYIDDFARKVTVRNNVLSGMPMGIFLHNASDVVVEDNKIWLPTTVGLWASMDQLDADWTRGNVFRNNLIVPIVQSDITTDLVPKFITSQAIWLWHFVDGEAALAAGRNSFSGNVVVQLQGPLATHAWLRGPRGERYVNSVEWQSINPADPPPLRPVRFAAVVPTLGPELVSSGSFDNGLGPWRKYENPAGKGYSILALAGVAKCPATCIGFTAGHPFDLLASLPFTLQAGVPHVYRWSAQMPAAAGAVVGPPFVSRESSPWDTWADRRGFVGYGPRQAAAGETLQYETYFVAKASAPARVNLQVETTGVQVAFSEVSVRAVVAYSAPKPSDWSAVAYAFDGKDLMIGCTELGWSAGCSAMELNGESVKLPMTLPAGTMRLLLRADSPYRR